MSKIAATASSYCFLSISHFLLFEQVLSHQLPMHLLRDAGRYPKRGISTFKPGFRAHDFEHAGPRFEIRAERIGVQPPQGCKLVDAVVLFCGGIGGACAHTKPVEQLGLVWGIGVYNPKGSGLLSAPTDTGWPHMPSNRQASTV